MRSRACWSTTRVLASEAKWFMSELTTMDTWRPRFVRTSATLAAAPPSLWGRGSPTAMGMMRMCGFLAHRKGRTTSRECSCRCATRSAVRAGSAARMAAASSASTSISAPGRNHFPSGHTARGAPMPVWLGPRSRTVSVSLAWARVRPATPPEKTCPACGTMASRVRVSRSVSPRMQALAVASH
jgi:hypothetical protein